MRAALYLRRSTDEITQADSINAQEEVLIAYAELKRIDIVRRYVENASGRRVDGREEFQRLLRDVRDGAPFELILVRDVSRWGRFDNIDESAYWEFFCCLHGVRVVYVEEGLTDDGSAMNAVMKTIKRVAAADASRQKARLVQRAQYRTVQRGFRLGGNPPYGMVRVLVTPDGAPIQVLRTGERKLINAHRMKLAPGPEDEVRVVRRVFQMFADGSTIRTISRTLNDDAIPSPSGRRWRDCTVRDMLQRRAYAGIAYCRFRASQNFAEPEVVHVDGAWEPVIPKELWEAVQRRFAMRRVRRSPEGLAKQLRERFDFWGVIDDPRSLGATGGPQRETYRRYFERGEEEAMELACAEEIARERAVVVAEFGRHFTVHDDGRTLVLNGMLRVGFKATFPRKHRLGSLHWRFIFDGNEPQDVTIGLAFSPTKTVAVYFRLVNVLFRGRKKVVAPTMHSHATRTATRSLEQLVRGLRRDLLRYSSVARAKFLEAIKDLPVINTYEVARRLGWPEAKGLTLYKKLHREGVPLPPLKRQTGRRMTLVCDVCGKERTMLVSNALQHKSTLCAPCFRLSQAKYRTCPDCGDRRRLGRGEFKRLRQGLNTRCRSCSNKRVNPKGKQTKVTRDARTGRFLPSHKGVTAQ